MEARVGCGDRLAALLTCGNCFHVAPFAGEPCYPLAEIGQDRRRFGRARQVVLLAGVALPVAAAAAQS